MLVAKQLQRTGVMEKSSHFLLLTYGMFCKYSTLRLLFLCLLEAAQISAQALVNSCSIAY